MNNTVKAKGMRGTIIKDMHGQYMFRVYDQDHNFVDYDLQHSDLAVIIDDDDACLYHGSNNVLDHAPSTLGIAK
jgi:hypothetical protein